MHEPPADREQQWGRAARALLEDTGGGPADPFVLARCCRFRLHARERNGAMLRARHGVLHLYYDYRVSHEAQRSQVAKCVATFALKRRGIEPTDDAVAFVAKLLTPPSASHAVSGF